MYRGDSSSNRFLMERLEYLLLRLLLGLLARLPWWVIHCLCRLSAFLLEHALHYRRRVIRENLANSFPEKSEAERRKIERDFYLQFAASHPMRSWSGTSSYPTLRPYGRSSRSIHVPLLR